MKPLEPLPPMEPMKPMKGFSADAAERWWPESLGDSPNSAGAQNEMRYAYFGDKHRLALDQGDGHVVVYDTADHTVSGVHQRQTAQGKKLVFSAAGGEVDLNALRKVT